MYSTASTARQTRHFGLSIALIPRVLALILNNKCIAYGAVDRTLKPQRKRVGSDTISGAITFANLLRHCTKMLLSSQFNYWQ
jgi:hypothetical protein